MLIPFKRLHSRYMVKNPPKGVLHLGANSGQEAADYDWFGIKDVHWVEALPEVYQRLLLHLESYPTHLAWLACLSDKDGEKITFKVTSNEAQSSSFLEFGTHAKEHPSVKVIRTEPMTTTRLDTLFATPGITLGPHWFLNVDLQGAELLALKGMGTYLDGFDYVYIEVNERELYLGCPMVEEIDEYLERFGFVGREVKMTKAGWGDKFYERIAEPKA